MDGKVTDLKERTFNYARRIVKLYFALPKSEPAKTFGQQLLRSGTSVGANYSEAEFARSRAEFASISGICLRELNETSFWLKLIESENLIKPNLLSDLMRETSELIAIFVTTVKKVKERRD